jgi:hypothetical protein
MATYKEQEKLAESSSLPLKKKKVSTTKGSIKKP